MIVRDTPGAWELFFVLRGSVVQKIFPQIGAVAGLSLVVVLFQRSGLIHFEPIAPLALTVIGAALAIFAAFRNAAAYERWWEARKLLGLLVTDTCALARLSRSHIAALPGDEMPSRMARRCIVYFQVVCDALRNQSMGKDTGLCLLPAERAAVAISRNPPVRLLDYFSADIAASIAARRVSPQVAQILEDRVQGLAMAFSGAERIKATPMPFVYTLLVRRTAYLFCLLLPFGLVDSSGYWTPLLAAIVAYAFFGLDAVGDDLASPFTASANTMPLDALARWVEICILESLGETQLPQPLKPVHFLLT